MIILCSPLPSRLRLYYYTMLVWMQMSATAINHDVKGDEIIREDWKQKKSIYSFRKFSLVYLRILFL